MRALRSLYLIAPVLVMACGKGSKSAPAAARPAPPAAPTAEAEYTVIIKSTWTKRTHPFEYPADAHFSGMIGASHNAKYSIFAVGRAAFWIGYLAAPWARAFGLGLTFYPTAVALVWLAIRSL